MGSPIAVHHIAVPQSALQRKKLPSDEIDELFDKWYRLYPNKKDRRAARRAYGAAINRGCTPFELQKGVRQYVAEVAGWNKHHIKHPATWLNGDSYLNEPAEPHQAATTLTTIECGRSPRHLLERVLFRGRGSDFSRHFISYLLDGAVGLRLSLDRSALARSLATLYLRIEAERRLRNFEVQDYEMLMGDSALLHQYIEWIGEQGWYTASLKVLDFDSPAFGQFRREAALMDQFGRDPITKQSRFSS